MYILYGDSSMAFIQIQNNCHTIVVINNHLWVLDEEILSPYYTIEVACTLVCTISSSLHSIT